MRHVSALAGILVVFAAPLASARAAEPSADKAGGRTKQPARLGAAFPQLPAWDGLAKSAAQAAAWADVAQSAWRAAVDLLSGQAPRVLSGNTAELLSGNSPKLLSEIQPRLLSGNRAKVLAENRASVLSDNRVSLFSDIKVEIRVVGSGNNTAGPSAGANPGTVVGRLHDESRSAADPVRRAARQMLQAADDLRAAGRPELAEQLRRQARELENAK